MAEILKSATAIRVPEKTIVIDEHIELPDQRITFDSGAIVDPGDRVYVLAWVEDSKGQIRGDTKKVLYEFPDKPLIPGNEFIGAIAIGFVESPKPGKAEAVIEDLKA